MHSKLPYFTIGRKYSKFVLIFLLSCLSVVVLVGLAALRKTSLSTTLERAFPILLESFFISPFQIIYV